ncbi:MAG: NUDIX hydrolase [Candidatus Melainabacteria bacterium]|nr:NUDIX hydrolase [Candidatus Melainabacteria bacterium]
MINNKSQGKKTHSYRPNFRVSVIIVNDKEEILLVQHKKGQRYYWVLPGGRIEYGENFASCAVRELKEETNLDIRFGKVVFLSEAIAPDRSRHIINIYATGEVLGGELKLGAYDPDPVLADVGWKPIHELAKVTLYPPVADQIIEAYQNGFKEMKYLGNLWV